MTYFVLEAVLPIAALRRTKLVLAEQSLSHEPGI